MKNETEILKVLFSISTGLFLMVVLRILFLGFHYMIIILLGILGTMVLYGLTDLPDQEKFKPFLIGGILLFGIINLIISLIILI